MSDQQLNNEIKNIILEEYEKQKDSFDDDDIENIIKKNLLIWRYALSGKDAKTCADHMITMLKWRQRIGLSKMKGSDFPAEFYQIGALFTINHYYHIRACRYRKVSKMEQVVESFILYLFEESCKKNHYGNITICYDFKGFTMQNINMDLFMKMLELFFKYFPLNSEDCIIVYEFPRILQPIWSVVKFNIPAHLRQIFHFVRGDEVCNWIPKDLLPPYFPGGTCTIDYLNFPDGCLQLSLYGQQKGLTPKEINHAEKLFNIFLIEAEQEKKLIQFLLEKGEKSS